MVRLIIGMWFLSVACCLTAAPTPLTVKEVSLMLRSGYSSEVLLQELSKRKFADTLDSVAEAQLVKAGASKSLISTLESGVYQLSSAEIAKWKTQQSTVGAQIAANPVSQNPN